jgi:hypothetical protein
MKIKHIQVVLLMLMVLPAFTSCKKYLDIVPDNIATIENAFTRRNEAEKFLFTCYSFLPKSGDLTGNPAFYAGDEISLIWPTVDFALNPAAYNIARGNQNVVDPFANFWDGSQEGQSLFIALRDCNIFLENIGKVPDMDQFEKDQWSAEVKFLKAYYLFYLVRMYGPIPLPKKNLEVSAGIKEIKVYRAPVDSCFNYMIQLIDSAEVFLPEIIADRVDGLGRITKPIALAIKAKMLVTAASPLFNGNTDYANFKDNRGQLLFNTTVDHSKWQKAALACKEAIDLCEKVGIQLYYYAQDVAQFDLSDETYTKMSIRNAVSEKWNSEIIWANTNSMVTTLQAYCLPRGLVESNVQPRGQLAPPLKIVEEFYTNHGLPITSDKDWNYAARFNLRIASDTDKIHIGLGYTTAALNFDREPRFYADLGFDGGTWYGQGKYDDNDQYVLKAKKGQPASQQVQFAYSTTGYWVKKLVNYKDVVGASATSIEPYAWPEMRLSDLYLLYSESLNEASEGTEVDPEAYKWIDLVRKRAGIPSVEDAWSGYSTEPTKFKTQKGFRDIIHQERLIEMAFEGDRYWSLLRWKEASKEFNEPITGWDIEQSSPEAYYRPRVIFNQRFGLKNYFWPIKDNNITVNRNLVQNPGW